MSAAVPVSVRSGATVRAALAAAAERLASAGCDSPRLDAELLLSHALGLSPAGLVMESGAVLGDADERLFWSLVERRAAREPVAYVVGRRGFRRLELAVDPRVLTPRPETELLVEVAAEVAPAGGRVHDVGTGSGAVALALKHERPDLHVSGSDRSAEALAVARENAERLGLEVALLEADGLPAGPFDLVVANLPYVTAAELDALEPEVRDWEPRIALDGGGADGLGAIRALVGRATAGTALALEHAPHQSAAVRELLRPGAATRRDLAGRERVTLGHAP